MADARATLTALLPRLEAAARPVVDASALAELDSAAVAVLLECRRRAAAAGRPFELIGAPPKLTQLAKLYGVAPLLGLA
jgi:phospholipid transport system transporter-binding protein